MGGVFEAHPRAHKETLAWLFDATRLIAHRCLPPFAAQVVDPNKPVNYVELHAHISRDDSFSLEG